MELIKAIGISTIHNDHNPVFTDAERQEAHQLGIEAMIAIIAIRCGAISNVNELLPSETRPVSSDTPTRKFYLAKATGTITPKPANGEPTPSTMSLHPRTPDSKPSDANPDTSMLRTGGDSRQISRKSRSSPPETQNTPTNNQKPDTRPHQSQNKAIEK